MGEWMAAHDQTPELVISSPARRARQTAARCADAAGYRGEIRVEKALYANGPGAYPASLARLDDTIRSVMLVGHNPDISIAVETLSGAYNRMPTTALARIELPIDRWSAWEAQRGQLAWVQLPEQDRRSLLHLRVKRVAQTVAQQVESQHTEHRRHPREKDDMR